MTNTDDLVKQLKRSSRSDSILVPRIEQFMQRQIEVEDDEDRYYLESLVRARSQPRTKGVYSPSMLSECIRKVYFIKTEQKRHAVARPDSNAIFLDGNFRHFKWQFLIWKMHRAGILELIDTGSICRGAEIYVCNERGDYGGTLDNLVYLPWIDAVTTIDWKGMNGNSFLNSVANGPGVRYSNQSVGYAGLANASLRKYLPKKIEWVLVVGENKNGAVRTRSVNSPLGLKEWKIDLVDYQSNVAKRLKRLRYFERKEEVPLPECVSTRRLMFKSCPFSWYCLGEVQAIEREKQKKRSVKNKSDKLKVVFNTERRDRLPRKLSK